MKLLERMGYSADVAEDGSEAVAANERSRYDLILMDVQMPEMDGLEATRRIIDQCGSDRPRIVALTADAMQGDRERCLAAGMDDYLTKPIRPDELAGALEQVVPRADGAPAAHALDAGALERLAEAAGGDPEFVGVLLETFADEAPAALAELRAGLDSGDAEAVRRAAHTLKSNAATFGATELAELCAEVESRARDGDLTDGDAGLDRIEGAYAVVKTQLAVIREDLA